MKIAIASLGRFHVLDLARELHALGHSVVFYSEVPTRRVQKFGFPAQNTRCLLLYVLPLACWFRRGPALFRKRVSDWLTLMMDWVIAWKLERCDVFIGMSGLCLKSAQRAREKYGAWIFIERGSTHILRQKEILDQLRQLGMPGEGVSSFDLQRELASYELADVITIPSLHVEESFQPYGHLREKLFRNPYGADLTCFSATTTPDWQQPTLLFVGQWGFRKGCDLLEPIMEKLPGVRLMHVGGLGDYPWPKAGNFEHCPAVNEWELPKYYAQAHVFVLASREEGFAKVLLQAAACGLPIVCTDQTGGRDLQQMVGAANFVKVVACDDVDAFAAAVRQALDYARAHPGLRSLPDAVREQVSWRSYGQRYSAKLAEVGRTG